MDNWKLQLVLTIFCAFVKTYQALSSTVEEEGGLPLAWQESLETGRTKPVVNMIKRSKALRFYGLMGKRSGTKNSFKVNRRNKGEIFVGLMGIVSSDEHLTRMIPSSRTTAVQVLEKPPQHETSEEWVQIMY